MECVVQWSVPDCPCIDVVVASRQKTYTVQRFKKEKPILFFLLFVILVAVIQVIWFQLVDFVLCEQLYNSYIYICAHTLCTLYIRVLLFDSSYFLFHSQFDGRMPTIFHCVVRSSRQQFRYFSPSIS